MNESLEAQNMNQYNVDSNNILVIAEGKDYCVIPDRGGEKFLDVDIAHSPSPIH